MINEKTILSFADDKLTLMQWLKKVEASLDGASLKSVEPVQVKDGYFNLIFHFEDGTTIETPTAIELKGFKGDKGDKGDRGDKGDPLDVALIPSGTDILTFDFTPYGSGSLFIGNNLKGMPTEIDPQHSQVVVQLLRNNSTLYCLKVWNTGLYQGNQGEYIIYHYADAYAGWKTITTDDKVFDLANIVENVNANINQFPINAQPKISYAKFTRINNVLWGIMTFSITPTEIIKKGGFFAFKTDTLSQEIREKIILINGKPMTEATAGSDPITNYRIANMQYSSGGIAVNIPCYYGIFAQQKTIIVYLAHEQMEKGIKYSFDIRVPLLLV